jgi:hypothetical protein
MTEAGVKVRRNLGFLIEFEGEDMNIYIFSDHFQFEMLGSD